eukprot:gene3417-31687_t
MKLLAVLTSCVVAVSAKWPHPRQGQEHVDNVPASFDCAMRKTAYAYGKQLVPSQGKFESLYYALDLNDPSCQGEMVEEKTALPIKDERLNPSIQLAADLAASATEKTAVVLRDGTHYIADTITLTSKHSNLNFMSFPGESATVSGGTALKTTWKKATGMANASMNVYVADISGQVADVPGLQMTDSAGALSRATRKWTPPNFNRFGPVDFYTDNQTATQRTDTPSNCEHPSGGGAFAFRTPTGVVATPKTLPNSPYKDASDAIFFVWRPARSDNVIIGWAKAKLGMK